MKNRYERSLDLGFTLLEDQLTHVQSMLNNPNISYMWKLSIDHADPRLSERLADLDLKLAYAEAFYAPPMMFTNIHLDGKFMDNHVKLNWVYGGQGSMMNWWDIKPGYDQPVQHENMLGTNCIRFTEDQVDLVWSAPVGQPSLVNVGKIHNVSNFTAEARWCLSYVLRDLRTGKLAQWDDVISRF